MTAARARPRPRPDAARSGPTPTPRAAERPADAAGLARFERIQVLPSTIEHRTRAKRPGGAMTGGPVWPAEAQDGIVRFISRGVALDAPQRPVDRCERVLDEPCLWGGYIQDHFGHFVAEHCGRLLRSRVERPDDLVLFVHEPGATVETLPRFVVEVLGWFGISLDRVHLVDRPTLVRELRVAPQAEPYKSGPPDEADLDRLDRHVAAAGLPARPCDVVFVGRAGMVARGQGGHVGEAYLADRLAALGAGVVDPAAIPLRDQLAAYAGARHLVFAEGSAIHGRQLLGRVDQAITVLQRRPGRTPAAANLGPRCRTLTYVRAARHTVAPVLRWRLPTESLAIAFYDVPRLHRDLAALGLDLGPAWDHAAYVRACRSDLAAWLAALAARADLFDIDATTAGLEEVMARKPLRRPAPAVAPTS